MSFNAWMFLVICLLTIGELFFSAITIALRSFSHGKIKEAFKAYSQENFFDALVENRDKLVLAAALYRFVFLAGIFISILILFAGVSRPLTVTGYIFSFAITVLIYWIFALAVPHFWAKYNGEKIIAKSYTLLMLLSKLALPILIVLESYDLVVRRLAGVPEATEEEEQEEKQEEFLNGLEQRRIEGVVDKQQQWMIERVLRLSETTADEIMTPRTDIVAIELGCPREKILDTIISAGHSRVPVFRENIDSIIGFVYAKDLLTEVGKDPQHFTMADVMRKAYFVPETKLLRELLHEFQTQKLHIAVVLDEYGGTAGIVTIEDILEELVGEITDEYEEIPPEPVNQIEENVLEVDARTDIDDLNHHYDLDLPSEEDFDTVGGFVLAQLGRIPKTGESFRYKNITFTVALAETRKIKRVRLEIDKEPE